MEKRIKSLEKQFQSLDQKINKTPNIYPKFDKLSKGWRKFEYEGLSYYLVPLSDETKKKKI